jgi:hypothetical protein
MLQINRLVVIALAGTLLFTSIQAQTFSGTIPIPEVSGVVATSGNRLVLVADEGYDVRILTNASKVLKNGSAGGFSANLRPAIANVTVPTIKTIANDLEDVAWDEVGHAAYAITSHSLNKDQEVKPARYKLVRLSFNDTNSTVTRLEIDTLKEAFKSILTFAERAMGRPNGTGGNNGTFNIEGLAFDPERRALLIGLRSPTGFIKGMSGAMILTLRNPEALFAHSGTVTPDIDPDVNYLYLGGLGIRGMAYDPASKGYWILAGNSGDPAPGSSAQRVPASVWFWSPNNPDYLPRLIKTSITSDLNLEGICLLTVEGQRGLLLVSDDGDESSNNVSRFVWVPLPRTLVHRPQ